MKHALYMCMGRLCRVVFIINEGHRFTPNRVQLPRSLRTIDAVGGGQSSINKGQGLYCFIPNRVQVPRSLRTIAAVREQ